ncbi:3605_t:CDS:2, partial [Ambispora gerdemannii]
CSKELLILSCIQTEVIIGEYYPDINALLGGCATTEKEKLKKQLVKHLSALSVNSTSNKEVWIYYHKGNYLEVLQARKVKGKNNGTKPAANGDSYRTDIVSTRG